MNRVKLYLFIYFIIVLSAVSAGPACEWFGHGHFCPSQPPCPSGMVEIHRMQRGFSPVAYFGFPCLWGEKVLCCKKYAVRADFKKHCFTRHFQLDESCPEGTMELYHERKDVTLTTCCKDGTFTLWMGRDSSFASYEHEERWYRGATVIGAGISALALFTAAVVLPLLVAHLGTSTANLQEELDFCTSTSHNLWDQLEQLEDRTGHESSLRRQNYLVKKSTRASIVPEISSREKRSMRFRRQYGEAAAPATKESICIKGDPGPQGPPGYDGAPGKDGKAGHAGTPGADAEDGMVVCFDCYIGEPGPPGKPGPKGTRGKAGPGGAPGQHGKPGYKGAPGKRGPAGQDGYPGRPGKKGTDGVVEEVYMRPGPLGAPGPAGPRGDSATPGLPGKDGAPGAPGAEGAPGRDGADGGRGAPGEPGAKGHAGPTGGCGHCPPARLPPGY